MLRFLTTYPLQLSGVAHTSVQDLICVKEERVVLESAENGSFFFFLKVEDSDERRSVRCSSLELPAAPLHSADTGWFVCSTQCASA